MILASPRQQPLAVVLLQLGGPTSIAEVKPFLESMFRDPDLLDLPIPVSIRNWLARRFAAWRARSSVRLYESIGGKSPIRDITLRQAELLQEALQGKLTCRVFVAMRYGSPTTQSAVTAVRKAGCGHILLLPLYPQYSAATTGSSINEWTRRCRQAGLVLPTDAIDSYGNSETYLAAIGERMQEALARFPPEVNPHVVFSAHSLPMKLVRQGDPYQQQIEETVRLVCQRYSPTFPHTLCYQSRLGPQRWLGPNLASTLKRLGGSGAQAVLVVPIAFVSDHLETLSEINIEARQLARANGIRHFEMTEGLNDSPTFIRALRDTVLERSRRVRRR